MTMRQQQQCPSTDGTRRCGLHLGHYADERTDHTDNGHYWDAARENELRPLADALTLHVRGIEDVRIEQTGGNVYNVEGMLGGLRLNADEQGWSLTDQDGASVAWGGWFVPDGHSHVAPDAYALTLDEDTGALDPDECEAAAVAFASAYLTL